jgi:TPR repeat protein
MRLSNQKLIRGKQYMLKLITHCVFLFQCLTIAGTLSAAENWSLQIAEEAFINGDSKTAVTHWQGLAALGDIVAMNNLGYAHEKGLIVHQNDKLALVWYRKAANHGFPTAMFNVGEALYEGRGTNSNSVEALKWLILAGSNGDPEAQRLASTVSKKLTESDVKEAIQRANRWRPEK